VKRESHAVFLFGIGEDSLYRFAAQAVALFACPRMAEVLGLLNVVFPNVLGDYLLMALALCASGKVRTRCANLRIACENPVAFPSCRAVR
jgi:hypothetical protein